MRGTHLAALPAGIESAAAPVLLVDVPTSSVVYANPAAAELAPEATPPVSVDTWSKLAGLTDLDGRPLQRAWSPLHHAAEGHQVSGQPVRVAGGGDDVLWVTGIPLPGPEGEGPVALIVLVRLDETEGAQERLLDLVWQRALARAGIAMAVGDARRPGFPLLWVNAAFTRLTGYEPAEVVGRSVGVFRGRGTDQVVVDRLRQALHQRHPVTEVLITYRKDGSPFWNEVTISPVTDASGREDHFVAVLTDVTERVLLEHQREAAWAAAEETSRHLRLLTEAADLLSATLDVDDVVRQLTRLVVPVLADYCWIDLLDEPHGNTAHRAAAHHRRSEQIDALYRLGEVYTPRVGGSDPASSVLSGGPPVLLPDLPDDFWPPESWPPEVVHEIRQLRPMSMIVVPLRARGRVLGTLTLCTERPYGRRYTQRDAEVAADLAGRAALAVDNARLYLREHEAAQILQLSLLPELPDVPGLLLAARYLAGAGETHVGGDWYDVLPLPDGAVGLVVGDVVGHDLRAAAVMGQLRGLLRACAWEGGRPGEVLDRCEHMVHGLQVDAMATIAYLRLEPADGGFRRVSYANAGHPAPLLRSPDGQVTWLDDARSLLIGAVPGNSRQDAWAECPDGSLLLLYTDGIIEVRGTDPDERAERLRQVVADMPPDCGVDEVCARVLDAMVDRELQDDVALLAVRTAGTG